MTLPVADVHGREAEDLDGRVDMIVGARHPRVGRDLRPPRNVDSLRPSRKTGGRQTSRGGGFSEDQQGGESPAKSIAGHSRDGS